jgi:hypothetical protein
VRTLSRLVLAASLAGTALLAPAPANAAVENCWDEPCYECFMYPCGGKQWVEFICRDKLGVCS